MNDLRLNQFAPLSGIPMAVLWLVGIVSISLAGGFGYTDSSEAVVESLRANHAQLRGGALIVGFLSVVFLLWFAGSVSDRLRERKNERLGMIAFGGAVVCVIGLTLGYGILSVAAARAGRSASLDLQYAAFVKDLYSVALANLLSVGLATFIGATGVGALRSGVLPAWLGWVSVVFGVGLLTPFHWLFEGLSIIWIIVVSIGLYRKGLNTDRTQAIQSLDSHHIQAAGR